MLTVDSDSVLVNRIVDAAVVVMSREPGERFVREWGEKNKVAVSS